MSTRLVVDTHAVRVLARLAADRSTDRATAAFQASELSAETDCYGLVGRALVTSQDDTFAAISQALRAQARAWDGTSQELLASARAFDAVEDAAVERFTGLMPR